MVIPAKYILTSTITKHLQSIEAAKSIIDAHPLPAEVETNIRRQSVLRSSLFSARIEGNPLTIEEVTGRPSNDQKKKEIYNILKGLTYIQRRGQRDMSQTAILELHKTVVTGLADREYVGKFRVEVSAIFNVSGIAIYMPPPPRQVSSLMEKLLKFINSDKEPFVPIRAALAHYSFEKIHPFLDGNGRVGRLILQGVMEKSGYGMKGLLSFEEYLDKHRSEYYRGFESSDKDVTDYLEFMLEALAESAERAKDVILKQRAAAPEDFLLPRRAEILRIIIEQKIVNFDMIKRRFLKINDRTLRYDLKQLQNARLIRKLGTTKGVYYEKVS
jgi:Fic family protein